MINCNLNQFETMSMCTGCTDWKMQIPSALNQYFFSYNVSIFNSETMLIIYGIGIERCVLFKCNANRWSCTCFRNGVWGGDLLLRYDFFFISIRNDVDVHRLYRLENANSIRFKPILFFLFRFVVQCQ
jgi:hypothetical protein